LIFRNPTSRIKVGQNEYAVLQPLLPEQVERSVATALTLAARLVLALAAVHAARVAQIAALVLDDVDLGNRRLTIAGRARPLDELTLKLLTDWLDHRRRRWPSTANLHLLIKPDRQHDRPGQQPLDQCSNARTGRHLGAASR
jgi:integrase